MQHAICTTSSANAVPRRATRTSLHVRAQKAEAPRRQAAPLAVIVPAVAAAILMVSGPSEAKPRPSNSTEASASGYEMTGIKHSGIKPSQRKELMANARAEALKAQKGVENVAKK